MLAIGDAFVAALFVGASVVVALGDYVVVALSVEAASVAVSVEASSNDASVALSVFLYSDLIILSHDRFFIDNCSSGSKYIRDSFKTLSNVVLKYSSPESVCDIAGGRLDIGR